MAMEDQDSGSWVRIDIYLSSKGRDVLGKAKAMRQTKSSFVAAVVERYGEAYLAELRKVGLREVPVKKVAGP